ncbi:MAG: GNAT family N-acetyltransferase [Lachnospiraceae bacterium]|nr:GNAT family N-acetyltransferase [Lachnospiraceae bacterium]
MEFRVFVMQYEGKVGVQSEISCVPFEEAYFEEYKKIYNECFYDMRKALERKPYCWLNEYSQISEHVGEIYLLLEQGEIIGSVACYGNEVDDLIVNQRFQHRGYGRKLLGWAMERIRERSSEPITLHVAEWNEKAVSLYRSCGFEIAEVLTIGNTAET